MTMDQQDKHLEEDVQAYMYVDVNFQDLPIIVWRLEEIQRTQEYNPLYQEMAL